MWHWREREGEPAREKRREKPYNKGLPHIDGSGVFRGAEEDVGRAIPKGHHFIRVRLGGHGLGASQSKIGQLQRTDWQFKKFNFLLGKRKSICLNIFYLYFFFRSPSNKKKLAMQKFDLYSAQLSTRCSVSHPIAFIWRLKKTIEFPLNISSNSFFILRIENHVPPSCSHLPILVIFSTILYG